MRVRSNKERHRGIARARRRAHGHLTLLLLLVALLGACGDDGASLGPDAPGGLDAAAVVDGASGCAVPQVAGLDGYLAGAVGHLAAAPRASAAARTATRGYLMTELAGLGLDVSVDSYGQGANVVGRLAATAPGASTWILIGAHFDTVAVSPGANDDATGVAAVLGVARNLAAQPCRRHGLMVVGFDQEEIGLIGSTALAGRLFAAGTALVAVHTVDQVGWDRDGDHRFEIELPTAGLWAEYQAAAAATGSPVGRTTSAGTDHASFRERGYAAAGVTEEFVGGDTTPHYHTAGDTLATVDLAYTARAVRLVSYVVGRELGADP